MKNFWNDFKSSAQGRRAIYALAPMAGVTDSAFRQICKSFGADVVYSEMASVNALVYSPKKTLEMLKFSKVEQPYVVQLFGSELKNFIKAVKIVEKKIKPDGIDINFGCPVPKVARQKAGAELMKDLKLSREIIQSVVRTICELSLQLPVSVKIRSQAGQVSALDFLKNIKDLDVKAVMIHGRSLGQGFSGPVDCQIIKDAKKYFKGVILANGGVKSYEDAQELLKKTNAHGVGIARGALGRPWIFKAASTGQSVERAPKPIFKIALKHAKLAQKLKGQQGIIEMRKHLCWYVQGLPGARELRKNLVKVESMGDIKKVLKNFL